jgi:hypothetical protein
MVVKDGQRQIFQWNIVLLSILVASLQVSADQIVMQSGDQLVGRLVALTNDTLVVQSELLGTVRLPRSKVVSITLSTSPVPNSVRLPVQTNLPLVTAAAGTNAGPDFSASLRQLGSNTNSVQQVRDQLLSTAGPDANKKYNELLGGLMSGKLDVNDIRAQAASAANQIRALKRELGDDAGGSLDGYLTILESFLGETAAPTGSSAMAADAAKKPKSAPPGAND